MTKKDEEEEIVFNTRLPAAQVERIRAYAYYRRVPIKDVTEAALKEFFQGRGDEIKKALEAYRNKDKPL